MESQDYPRFLNAIDEAIQGLELEARCYGYTDEPEHTELIELLENYKNKMKEARSKQYAGMEKVCPMETSPSEAPKPL